MTRAERYWKTQRLSVETDRHHCFTSGDIPKTDGGQILPHLCSSLMISMKLDRHTKWSLLDQKYFTVSMPLFTASHSFRHLVAMRLSPLMPFLLNVVEKLARMGRKATP